MREAPALLLRMREGETEVAPPLVPRTEEAEIAPALFLRMMSPEPRGAGQLAEYSKDPKYVPGTILNSTRHNPRGGRHGGANANGNATRDGTMRKRWRPGAGETDALTQHRSGTDTRLQHEGAVARIHAPPRVDKGKGKTRAEDKAMDVDVDVDVDVEVVDMDEGERMPSRPPPPLFRPPLPPPVSLAADFYTDWTSLSNDMGPRR
ncbi:hypothetical protein B0H13DRAFT_1898369 [Mycena leptocephala]|nr:hypothetical protein B0H13DRAFT_1898369 [Mycena leptocephala]